MTAEEKERFNYLCKRIAVETDPDIFQQLVKDLNELVRQKKERMQPMARTN